jgi:hypothetical protein
MKIETGVEYWMTEKKMKDAWEYGGYNIFSLDDGRSYEWDVLDLWFNLKDKKIYYYYDSGCSCNSPYDGDPVLSEVTSYNEVVALLDQWSISNITANDLSMAKEQAYRFFGALEGKELEVKVNLKISSLGDLLTKTFKAGKGEYGEGKEEAVLLVASKAGFDLYHIDPGQKLISNLPETHLSFVV